MAKNTQSKEITFWNLLKDNKIEIPIIQRDYAQGRIGKEYLRKTFLESLKSALDSALKNVGNNEKLKLDFVYGTSENGKIYPLDGQQRLTTLWLLHWYIALRSGNLNKELCQTFSCFTYETRISSREFCKQLCNYDNWEGYQWSGNISEYIKDQHWFSSAWLQDPTISSMLNMLAGTKPTDEEKEDIIDGIEEIFKDHKDDEQFKNYWKILTKPQCPIIFYYLPITDMGLTDDLYIKMNARGKQLSSFENLKADLIGYVRKQTNTNNEWKKFLNVEDRDNYLPLLLDTKWTDIFWDYKCRKDDSSPYKIDETFFAFINRFFWNEVVLDYIANSNNSKEQEEKIVNSKSYKFFNNTEDTKFFDTTIVYHGLSAYKYKEIKNGEYEIPISFFDKLIKVIGTYSSLRKNMETKEDNSILDKELFSPFENDSQFYFIPHYLANITNIETDKKKIKTKDNVIYDNDRNEILSITHLTQVQRVVFSAVCKFFNACTGINEDTPIALKRWMRVVWNLVSGLDKKGLPQIRTVDTMLKAITFIDDLNPLDVYGSLFKLREKYKHESDWKDNFTARCFEECIKAEKILEDNSWETHFITEEKKYQGSIRFLFLKKDKIDWDNYSTKVQNMISERKKFYLQLISHCKEESELTAILYSLNENAWRINLLNSILFDPIHDMLLNNIVTCDERTKDLQDAVITRITEAGIGSNEEIYRLKQMGDNYYFEARYTRDKTDPIFPKQV